jgi:hypothetical protein
MNTPRFLANVIKPGKNAALKIIKTGIIKTFAE